MPSPRSPGVKLCQALRREYGFNAISLMPTNLYGPGDNFDLEQAHVLPALIRRIHEAKLARRGARDGLGKRHCRGANFCTSTIWPMPSCTFYKQYDDEPIVNIGWGKDIAIRELAELLVSVIDYKGAAAFRYYEAGWHAS